MKYTPETTQRLVDAYTTGTTVAELAQEFSVPQRSIIAKLSSLGVYTRKPYTNKRGETPTKKSEHIERIATLLDMNLELLESLEKVNKVVLQRIEQVLSKTWP